MGPWTTTYLHTDDQFRQRLGGLRSRLLAAAVAVDGRERWGQLDETADVNFRTAECVSFYLLSRPPRRRPQVPPVPARRRPPGRAPLRRRFVDHHGPHARGAGRRLRGRRLRHARGRRVRSRRRLSFWFLDWRRRSVARHAFDKGDLVLFVSHKYHNVRDLLFYLPSPRRFRSSPSRGARAWCWWRSCGAARRRRAPTGARRSGRAGTRSRTCARGGRRWRRGCLGKDVVCESHGPRAVRETAYYRHNVSCLLTLLLAPRAPPHRHGLR